MVDFHTQSIIQIYGEKRMGTLATRPKINIEEYISEDETNEE